MYSTTMSAGVSSAPHSRAGLLNGRLSRRPRDDNSEKGEGNRGIVSARGRASCRDNPPDPLTAMKEPLGVQGAAPPCRGVGCPHKPSPSFIREDERRRAHRACSERAVGGVQGQQAPAGVWGVPTNLPLSFIREDERRAHSASCKSPVKYAELLASPRSRGHGPRSASDRCTCSRKARQQ